MRTAILSLSVVLIGCATATAPRASHRPPVTAARPTTSEDTAKRTPTSPSSEDVRAILGPHERFRIPVSDTTPVAGPVDAPVTIVEWADYECPFSARAESVVESLMRRYPDRQRRVWRHSLLPFHARAAAAAELATEAFTQGGNQAFWKVHQLLLQERTAKQRADILTPENLEQYARLAGLDLQRVRTAWTQQTHAALIAADQEAIFNLGPRGTPAFFVNGRFVPGATPGPLTEVVEDELARTERLSWLGLPNARV